MIMNMLICCSAFVTNEVEKGTPASVSDRVEKEPCGVKEFLLPLFLLSRFADIADS